MAPFTLIEQHAAALLTSARAFQFAAEQPGGSRSAVAALASVEEAMRTLGTGWQLLAADAVTPPPDEGLTADHRRMAAALQEVGAAFTRCARVCRDAEYVTAELSQPAADGDRAGRSLSPMRG